MKTIPQFKVNSEREAWINIVWSFAAFKGEEIQQVTADIFTRTFSYCSVYGKFKFTDTLEECKMIPYEYEANEVIDESLKYIHPEDYKTLFIYCLDVFSTIDTIDVEKIKRINYLRELLGIAESEANGFMEFLQIKNKKDIK